jgi:hypothetical protein
VAAAGLLTIVPALAGCGVFSPGVDQETPVAMTVSSDAIVQNTLEARYTCKGGTQAANPPLMLTGIQNSSHGLYEPLANITIEGLPKFDSKYTAGFTMLPCEEPVGKVYDKSIINDKIRANLEADAPGDRVRDVRFSGDIIPTFYMVYRPCWGSVYSYEGKYGDKICFASCSGTDAAKQYGTRPVDKDQKKRISKGFLPFKISLAIFVISIIVWFASGSGGFAGVMFWLSTASGIFGAIVRAVIIHKGKKALRASAPPHLENPSTIFSRRSAKADPTASIHR